MVSDALSPDTEVLSALRRSICAMPLEAGTSLGHYTITAPLGWAGLWLSVRSSWIVSAGTGIGRKW